MTSGSSKDIEKLEADLWEAADSLEGTIPWVSSGELTTMRIRRTSLNITEEAVEAGSRLVPAGTILAMDRLLLFHTLDAQRDQIREKAGDQLRARRDLLLPRLMSGELAV